MSNASWPITACKTKLCELNPQTPPACILTQRTRRKQRAEPVDPKSLERHVRQLLADKISGNQLGLWLLVPEHLRLSELLTYGSVGGVGRKPGPYPAANAGGWRRLPVATWWAARVAQFCR